MKHLTKKMLGIVLTMLLVLPLGMQDQQGVARAATTNCNLPITCYAISTGRVNTYQYSNGRYSYTGYISGSSDRCVISKVQSDGYCKVTYPASRGSKTAYAPSNNFFAKTDFSTATTTLGARKTVYRRANLSQSLGTVYANDRVQIVGVSGNNTQIIYPAGNSYKMGWVSGKYSVSGTSDGIANGTYIIRSALDQNKVVDAYGAAPVTNGTNIQLYSCNKGDTQIFTVTSVGSGWYKIICKWGNKSLDVHGGVGSNEANVELYDWHGGDNQLWKFEPAGNGYYYIKSKLGYYLDVWNGRTANETNIQIYQFNGGANQKWKLEAVAGNTGSFQMPLDSAYCSWRSSNNWSWAENSGASGNRTYHLGVDLLGSSDVVHAAGAGTVVRSGWNNANGNYVVIEHQISGTKLYSFYAHLASRSVNTGTWVDKGTQVGVVGNTGSSSRGKHLHFAMMNTLWNGSYWGYRTYFTGNSTTYNGVTYYNPIYIIQNGRLP